MSHGEPSPTGEEDGPFWLGALVLVVLALSGTYVEPYRTPVGQVLLVLLLSAYVATLIWMRRMAAGKPLPRFLDDAAAAKLL